MKLLELPGCVRERDHCSAESRAARQCRARVTQPSTDRHSSLSSASSCSVLNGGIRGSILGSTSLHDALSIISDVDFLSVFSFADAAIAVCAIPIAAGGRFEGQIAGAANSMRSERRSTIVLRRDDPLPDA